MPALVIRDLPTILHQRLKQEAERHHRSMNREIIAIPEVVLSERQPAALLPPVKPIVSVDGRHIADAIRRARDSRP